MGQKFIVAYFVIAAIAIVAVCLNASGEPSYKKYQRAAVPGDYTTPIAPALATWQCPTLSATGNRLTESC